jgi:hypothetical protein
LSVVVTTRNDNHGGDLNTRTQVFIDGLARQANRHQLHTELVVVEWNPPPERPPIDEELRWPEASPYFETRIIVVPHELHARLANADRLPLFQMIAKNVGIRRARGHFVLATNVDVLLSDDLAEHLARRRLSPQALYRVDRYDVESDVPAEADLDEQLAWCEEHVLRICRREGIVDVRDGNFYRIYESLKVPLWWAGYLWLFRYAWARLRQILGFAGVLVRRSRALPRRSLALLRLAIQLRRVVLHPGVHPRRTRSRRRILTPAQAWHKWRESCRHDWKVLREAIVGERARLRLHTNACGDFTLMSREAWEAVGGYPELELFSMHIDSLLLYQAHYRGIRETYLPHRLYHIEHAEGFRPEEQALEDLNRSLESRAIPQLTGAQFLADVIEMYKTKRPKFENPPGWGFADVALDERSPAAPARAGERVVRAG